MSGKSKASCVQICLSVNPIGIFAELKRWIFVTLSHYLVREAISREFVGQGTDWNLYFPLVQPVLAIWNRYLLPGLGNVSAGKWKNECGFYSRGQSEKEFHKDTHMLFFLMSASTLIIRHDSGPWTSSLQL